MVESIITEEKSEQLAKTIMFKICKGLGMVKRKREMDFIQEHLEAICEKVEPFLSQFHDSFHEEVMEDITKKDVDEDWLWNRYSEKVGFDEMMEIIENYVKYIA